MTALSSPCWLATLLRGVGLIFTLFLAGCVSTQYSPYSKDGKDLDDPFGRVVEYRHSRDFFRTPPDCIMVTPIKPAQLQPPHSQIIEQAMVKQLHQREVTVFSAKKIRRLARSQGLDPYQKAGFKQLAQSNSCGYQLSIIPIAGDHSFFLVWSGTRIGMEVILTRLEDDKILWQARHIARRSEGGAPLSLLSAPLNMVSAARFHGDEEVLYSLVDDATRRIFDTWPG
jgi:hypothetical protein